MANIATNIETKRKYIENLFHNVFMALDTTGENAKMYDEYFKGMNDTEFAKVMKTVGSEETYPILETEEFKREPTLHDIENGAKVLNIPLFERVIQYDEELKTFVSTPVPVPVGYLIQRRVQQLVIKKNKVTDNIDVRNPKTGQVTADSKTTRDSDMENYVLTILEADNIMKELLSFRADDMEAKAEAYSSLVRDGYVDLDTLPNNIDSKTALNTLDKYFIAAGIKTDLITPGLMLRYTMTDKDTSDLTRTSEKKVD